jgi:hypothetical protein
MIVNQSPAQNSSVNARGRIPKSVVKVVKRIGLSLDFPLSATASTLSTHFSRFEFILSMRIIALFTTIHVRAINQIPNDIEYGFPVKYSPIFTPSKARTIL